MNDIQKLYTELEFLIPKASVEALGKIGLPAIAKADLEQNIARLAHHVAPSYLPFATFDGSPLAIHLYPDKEVSTSPVVYIDTSSRTPQLVCDQFNDLPRGAWLWIARYFKDDCDTLRTATNTLASNIRGARSIQPELWDILATAPDYQPTWWGYNPKSATKQAWTIADVGHPFVELETVNKEDANTALAQLLTFMDGHTNPAPEILAGYIAAQVATGKTPSHEYILRILSAEAWLGGEEILKGFWKKTGEGLCEWDGTLKIALGVSGSLVGTPFAPLIGHPDAYSGKDKNGSELLIEAAEHFRNVGDYAGELCQLRNSAFVSLYAKGSYSRSLCERIADACNRIEPNSLAAKLACVYRSVSPNKA